MGVNVAVDVVADNGRGGGVEEINCPHELNSRPMIRRTITRKRFFISIHSLRTMLDVWVPTLFVDK
jgi:hypothetical protein